MMLFPESLQQLYCSPYRISHNFRVGGSLSVICFLLGTLAFSNQTWAQTPQWEGVWISEKGVITLEQDGETVSGKIGKNGTFDGTAKGDELAFQYKLQNEKGSGTWRLDSNKHFCSGKFSNGYRQGTWKAWKRDATGALAKPADFSGVWLTSYGTMMLEQDGKLIEGSIGPEGWSSVDTGEISGRQLDFEWTVRQFKGDGWLQQTSDGKRIFGVMNSSSGPSPWLGVRPEGYRQEVIPKAGKMIQGIADNGMLFNLRMPDGWKEGEPTDVIILLHGSNWTTTGMVAVTAKNWPEIGKRFAILGIQGQNWAKWSEPDDLRFNYTYINWVGKSKLQGFPYTHRESPFLVGHLLDEFKERFNFQRTFVGGHSQGGFLTYVMQMHYPDKIDGTFPIAGGMIIQAEPDNFDDEKLIQQQRETPMYILHGSKDFVVRTSMGQYAYNRLLAHDFARVKFHSPPNGHPYDFLPVDKAIRWLDMMTTHDAASLAKFADELVAAKQWRDVGAALDRAEALGEQEKFASARTAFEAAAKQKSESLLKQISENKDGTWVARYLDWEEAFSLAKCATPTIDAFRKLRKQHSPSAETLYKDARSAFQNRDREKGYAKYQEIVDKYYASPRYRAVKSSLEQRKRP